MRAVIYARYSSENQREASIEDQLRQCKAFLAGKGWTFVRSYEDRAMSGASAFRPAYQTMREDSRAGHFDITVAVSLDRFSRDQEDTAGLYKRLKHLGIPVVILLARRRPHNKGAGGDLDHARAKVAILHAGDRRLDSRLRRRRRWEFLQRHLSLEALRAFWCEDLRPLGTRPRAFLVAGTSQNVAQVIVSGTVPGIDAQPALEGDFGRVEITGLVERKGLVENLQRSIALGRRQAPRALAILLHRCLVGKVRSLSGRAVRLGKCRNARQQPGT